MLKTTLCFSLSQYKQQLTPSVALPMYTITCGPGSRVSMNLSKKIILMPAIIIVLLGGAGLLVIDEEIREGLGVRVERELKWLAESALEGLVISNRALSVTNVDAIAKRYGKISGARITFIDEFGAVTGDSKVAVGTISALANHKDRIEISEASRTGLGTANATVKP